MLYTFYHPHTDCPMGISLMNMRDVRVMEDSSRHKRDKYRYAVRIVHFGESLPMVIDTLMEEEACELVEKILKKIKENS